MPGAHRATRPFLLAIALLFAAPLAARQESPSRQEVDSKVQKTAGADDLPVLLWSDPKDISSLDLFDGSGGREHAPGENGEYKFINEDLNGTSTKFYVEDNEGIRWLVKVGEESKGETAATRLVWAMGYFADEDYYVARMHVSGMQKLRGAEPSVSPDGTVRDARLKRQDKDEGKKIANWDWSDNPFVGTRELNGLRVLMALLNNWDLTTANNKVYPNDKERHFVVSDLGASFGKTGGSSTRSKGVLKDYREAKFIEQVGPDFVDFTMATRPFFLKKPFLPDYYKMRVAIEKLAKHIPRADARWMGQQLSRLTPEQIRSAFRAAGYSTDQTEGYTQAVLARIAQLKPL
jgi:hypothetical protein